ncbi:lysozyme inhibitor LprI family protein [Mesorhizobium sp. B2-1-3A]|uniref:lysozyme inhibitor LprI family protein n=1 Tax=Mesorhizobium sp. B2-1-3A TaxID=2589971 RepID=UPI00112A3981|nr:lysozyme inhibitor LprI family protein [Mesorhizobium sp. B2-1-3A]TPM90358.1 lysozyme inhibitor LprI family protein [Mesorhizobium sp. B2-1-3A]
MRRTFLSACLVLLAGASGARAQECDRSDDSQQMMNICAGADYQAADAKLNAAYQNLIGSDDADGKRLLQAAQRAWIAFRDAECAHTTAARTGGSVHAMEVSQCLTRLTNDRVKQLAASANCEEGDAGCASSDEVEGDEVQ